MAIGGACISRKAAVSRAELQRETPAFTLIELLVVIATIALLLSIILPSLANARRANYRMVCQSNLRQMSAGALMYANNWDGCLPGNGITPGADWLGPDNPGGFDRAPQNGTLFTYVGEQPKVYFCPAHYLTGDEAFTTGIMRYSFTSPAVLVGAPIDRLRNCLIETRPTSSDGHWREADLSIMPPIFIEENSEFFLETTRDSCWSNIDGITDRHQGKGHLGIVDGHVESVKVMQKDPPAGFVRMTAFNFFYVTDDGRRISAKWYGDGSWDAIATLPGDP
jgi:type II secretory pathway pseudopilin PulG